MHPIITIDGPAGVGKSTLAKRVASHQGIAYLDTGAMFRLVALNVGEQGLSLSPQSLQKELERLSFSLAGTGSDAVLSCNDAVAGPEIRTEEMGALASELAQFPTVRAYLKKAQKALGESFSLVAEGRDMGTAVFPDARHKFFLDAAPEVRAARRVAQLRENGIQADLATIAAQIRERDHRDRNRAVAPLKPAKDAICIDTSAMDIDAVFAAITARL